MKFGISTVLLLTLSGMAASQRSGGIALEKSSRIEASDDLTGMARFFEEIDARAKLAKLTRLRRTNLQKDDLELRIWIGFGAVSLEGVVIRRQGNIWSATHLASMGRGQPGASQKVKLTPKSGWEELWRRLEQTSVLTLPRYGGTRATDGESVVVEVRSGAVYRVSTFDNPELSDTTDAKEIIQILAIVRSEFGVDR